ncbi:MULTISPECIES: sphingomyelin phosphodiesterase [Streptomyces]|uniref:sphingomyelin phosphodiesterase n=1 Tax=Streptomyces TaxID=1883 RepID=UPI002248C801|nr:sphingomyelin phosphodiesterase [Streptomyces sp. JHD 1]MCX2970662.1 sphingomyelin phosphodiesterase [Streptomyces sp. JHD 1]
MPQHPARRAVRRFAVTAAVLAATAAGLTAAPAAATPVPATAPAPSAPAPSSAEPQRLSVLTYNVFLFNRSLYPNWGQDQRAARIPRADFFRGHDVVVLQEAFDNPSSDALLSGAAADYPHRTPVLGRSRSGWDATGGSYSSFAPEDGGVSVLSRWPVLRQEQYVYADGCGSDGWSNKGFVYAVLDVRGERVHVVGTHAQSTDPGCGTGEAARVRASQFRELDAFLDRKAIPAHEQVVVAGDFNVDSHSSEYASLLATADLVDPDGRSGPAHSFDPVRNSVAADRYPGEAREHLDHVLHRAGHVRPAEWHNATVDERSAPWTVTSWGRSYTYTNLSDHYPVVGR